MQLNAVIFDYGGVLCTLPPDEQVRELAAMCRLDYDVFLRGFWAARHAYDRGDVTAREYWTGIGAPGGQSYTDEEVARFARADTMFWLHGEPRMTDWARRVRAAGFATGLLSNLPREIGEYFRHEIDLLSNFDHHTLSYDLRRAKPEPEIYQHACEGLGVEPGKALFIDDRAENVDGARAFGLNAVQFVSLEQLAEDLRRMSAPLPPIFA
mgnify:CR=1 FL=1